MNIRSHIAAILAIAAAFSGGHAFAQITGSRTYDRDTTVRVHGPADYQHTYKSGQSESNFRVPSGKTETLKVQSGDRITQSRSTLNR
ncbi:hypothetical protein C7T35_10115 [Variovorax sp. WS11]|uniref:hypothetical protein n=1 Tax=Variovorax sp. WS11 TaxID=1105204 RepID=UPI000D0D37A7|nr:hypothetical protein [Variovorax sp. WS11]NDZ12707.1 hypothetical protein [Variovorax sp. WS11]PSL84649.1 hypothetical protein C7T35_10115 [Variovorax sp. WS11]